VTLGHSGIAAQSLTVTCSQCRSASDPPEPTFSESIRAQNRQKATGTDARAALKQQTRAFPDGVRGM